MQIRNLLSALLFLGIGLGVGYYVGRHSTMTDAKRVTADTLGPWKAKFSIPGSVDLPEKMPVLKCGFSFSNSTDALLGHIHVTLANQSDHSYVVKYSIYGYDAKGTRLSDGGDQFAIGRHETVVRKVYLQSQESMLGKVGSVFVIQMVLEE